MAIDATALKFLYNFKMKRSQEGRFLTNFSFKTFKIMRILKSSNCSKTTVEFTFTKKKANVYSPWIACSVSNWKYLFWLN